ncbi:hypothetical protein ACQKP8_05295 [Photobacterium alginatilyticum]|uniref:hypothetical protein n=1 Tax=Photobacterium alginatilyticum TaxID=1775171 RepID=UPI004068B48F
MNLSLMLKEERYQKTIYLNNRPYDVLDIGEGKCTVIIVKSIREYIERNNNFQLNQRVIIVDVSKAIDDYPENITSVGQLLANDLHLLFDVFWLEEVEVKSEVESINMDAIYKVVSIRNDSCASLKCHSTE